VTGNHSSKPSGYYIQGDVGSGVTDSEAATREIVTDRNREQRLRYLARKKGIGLSTDLRGAAPQRGLPAAERLAEPSRRPHPISVSRVAASAGRGCDGGSDQEEEPRMTDPNEPRPPGWGERPPPPPAPPPQPSNGFGITALILGIIGVLTGMFPLLFWLAAVLGIIALVLGIIGARRAQQGYATNFRMSVIGAVLGGASLVLSFIGILVVADAFDEFDEDIDDDYSTPLDEPTP
jgi:hypothetical protein